MALVGSTLLIACGSGPGTTDPFAVLPSVPSTVWIAPTDLIPGTTAPNGAAVEIVPDDDVQAIVDANPPGTTYSFTPGVYREIQIVPKDGDVFVGTRGAILSGARLLIDLKKNGAFWSEGGFDQEGERRGSCVGARPTCSSPEDVYFNDELLTQVGSADELQPGAWFFDYENDTVYLADDPSGNKVEIALVPYAFSGSASSVMIRGFVIEKYANPAQRGAIGEKGTGPDWTVGENEIRLNHGIGVKAGTRARILGNYIHHNGQLGVGGSGKGILVEGNEIAYNNTGGFNPYWGGGGAKFVLTVGLVVADNYVHHNTQLGLGGSGSNILVEGNEIAYNNYEKKVNPFWGGGGAKWVMTRNLIVRNNYSHDNYGPGLWTDIDNDGVLYEGNRVEDNYHAGIKHEISYSAVIRNNTLKRNGFGNPYDVKGAGILIANSPNVEVYGNTLIGNKHGIGAVQHDRYDDPASWKSLGEFELKNLFVHDNYIEMSSGQTGFFVASGPYGDKPLTSWNNRFVHNTYKVSGNAKPFRWGYDLITVDQWQSHGQDQDGTFR